jgi:hypothetical protein
MSIDELIHTQTSKIGLIAAEISKTLSSPELATQENVDLLTQKLESWRREVPLMLQIPSLTSDHPPNVNSYQRRAILMVHVCYHVLIYKIISANLCSDYVPWRTDLAVPSAPGGNCGDPVD